MPNPTWAAVLTPWLIRFMTWPEVAFVVFMRHLQLSLLEVTFMRNTKWAREVNQCLFRMLVEHALSDMHAQSMASAQSVIYLTMTFLIISP